MKRTYISFIIFMILCIMSLSGISVATESNSTIASQELLVSPGTVNVTEGDEFDVTFTVVLVHMTCPVDFDDNTIDYPSFASIVSETGWEKITSSSYEKTVTFRANTPGDGEIIISRDCPRYGLLKSWIDITVGPTPVVTTTPPPTSETPLQTSTPSPTQSPSETPTGEEIMPVFDWDLMSGMTIEEISQLYAVDAQLIIDAFNIGVDSSTTLYDIHHLYKFKVSSIRSTIEWIYDIVTTSSAPEATPVPTEPPMPVSDNEDADDDLSFISRLDMKIVAKDYIFILMIAASIVLFALGVYTIRYFMLLASLVYFGFYLGGCMCHLGAIANFFIFDSWKLHWILLVFVPIAASLLFGRAFCGWVCYFGAFQEFLYKAREKVLPIRTRYVIPDKARYFKFVVLGAIVYFALTQSRSLFCEYDPFFYPISLMFSWDILGILTLLLIAASLFIERAFCRFICPLGAIFMITDKISLFKVRIDKDTCNSCKLCNRICPMKRDLVSGKGECISCGDCMIKCRKGSIYYGKARR